MNFSINSLYICVYDMKRALSFYENFFGKPADIKDEICSIFIIGNFRFGLFAFEKVSEPHPFGSNCLPSISVDSIDYLKEKINNIELCFPLTKIGANWVCEFIDSEGNHIEFTVPVSNIDDV